MSTFFPSRQPVGDKKWEVKLGNGRTVTVLARTFKAAKELVRQCYDTGIKKPFIDKGLFK